MTTTAGSIIKRAMRLLGELAPGETPSTDEYADGLETLNDLVADWNNERLMCYALRDESLTLVTSQSSYTIGPSGDLNTTRPVTIDRGWIVSGSNSFTGFRMIEEAEYDAIPDKTATAPWPDRALYRPTMATGTLLVYPVPSAASTLHLITQTPLAAFAATSDTVSLPPGWARALTANLAIEWAAEFETDPKPYVVKAAIDSKANIKRQNARPIKAYTELAALVGVRHENIITGQ